MYSGYFFFYIVYLFKVSLGFRCPVAFGARGILLLIVSIVCRWLMLINQLSYRYLQGQLYNKLVYIFVALRYKMYQKILCHPIKISEGGWMVNQQVTLLSFNNGTSETACDITFKFDNYLNQKVQHKK